MGAQYVAVWPITNPEAWTDDLIEEAEAELVEMAFADKVELIDAPTWERRGDRLVATAQVAPLQLPPAYSGPLPWESPQALLGYMMPDA